MSLPNETGRYIAKPQSWGVSESTGGAVEFACDFALSQYLNPATGEWEDVGHLGMSIPGYFYPVDKEGNANAKTIKSIKDALGWSGTSLVELNDSDYSQSEVQITVDVEEYQGKQKMKVKWLNPRDYVGGGVGKGDPEKVKGFDARFGAKLRAISGAAPSNGNGNGAAKPQPSPADIAKAKAWKAYAAKWPNTPTDEVQEGFRQRFRKYFPGRKPELVTSADWAQFQADEFEKKVPVSPIGDDVEFAGDDLPF